MKKTRLALFSVFSEDKRISMEIYLKNIIEAINNKNFFKFSVFIPRGFVFSIFFPSIFNIKKRALRYIYYPLFFFINKTEVNHITDQSYAHLSLLKTNKKVIVTVHDIIPILLWKRKLKTNLYRNPYLFRFSIFALRYADKIICVSEQTRKDLVEVCKINKAKTAVIYNPLNPIFKKLDTYEERDSKLKILLSGNHFYKNQLFSFEIINHLASDDNLNIEVTWIGGNINSLKNEITFSKNVDLICKNNLQNSDLLDIYNRSDLLLFPSLCEGFGWPPLESIACGTPVICSDIPIFHEILGEAGIFCNLNDKKDFCNAVIKVKENKDFRKETINLGLQQCKKYSVENFTNKLNSIYSLYL